MRNNQRHFYDFDQFRLDAERHRLLSNNEPVPLPPKAIEALIVLVQHPGKILEREALMQAVWAKTFVEDANLTVAISQLRKALGQKSNAAEYIETIPRVGYRFLGEVREVTEESAPLVVEKHTLAQTVIEEEYLPSDPTYAGPVIISNPSPVPTAVSIIRRKTAPLLAVAAALMILAGGSLYFKSTEQRSSMAGGIRPIVSIAVLPPKVLTVDTEDSSLSLGIADALITRLGSLRKVAVRPASSVTRYLDSEQSSLDLGRSLGVEAVLEGSLQRANGRVRVSLRLVEIASRNQLWAGSFEEKDKDIFRLQDSIAQQVAGALSLNLTPAEQSSLTKKPTTNRDAYDAYLKGKYFFSRRGEETKKASEHFRRAIELDPMFTEPYIGLANVHAFGAAWPEAEMLVGQALKLDDTKAEAHAAYGFIRMFHHWDWIGAEKALDRAIELDPNSSNAHHWKGVHLSLMGKLHEAKVEMKQALSLDPLSLIIMADIGQLHYFAHEYDQAIEYFNKVLGMDEDFQVALIYLSSAYSLMGQHQQAFEEGIRATPNLAETEKAKLRRIFGVSGTRGLCEHEIKRPRPPYEGEMSPFAAAQVYRCLGNRNQALIWLERSVEQRVFVLPFINVDPAWDSFRDEPRFKAILHHMGFSASQ